MSLIDKLVFGVLLIATLQIPVIADQYLQFVSGYYEATKAQVEAYQRNADTHGYSSVEAMILSLKSNPSAVVRADAELKEQTVAQLADLHMALGVLQNGHLFEKAWYMAAPNRWPRLEQVAVNFQPGIPLQFQEAAWCVLLALLSSMVLMWPVKAVSSKSKSSRNQKSKGAPA